MSRELSNRVLPIAAHLGPQFLPNQSALWQGGVSGLLVEGAGALGRHLGRVVRVFQTVLDEKFLGSLTADNGVDLFSKDGLDL